MTKPAVGRAIPQNERNILLLQSGNRCAFPGCGRTLVEPGTDQDDPTVVGQIAHILAHSPNGPRGGAGLSEDELNRHSNLVLLCGQHHKVVDSQPNTYSVPVLRQMKADHEERVRTAMSTSILSTPPVTEALEERIETTLLRVSLLPSIVHGAPCRYREGGERDVAQRLRYRRSGEDILPFLLRDGMLWAFHDLADPGGPFSDVVEAGATEERRAEEMWSQAEGQRRYVALLNKALVRHADRQGVGYDKLHDRYYFTMQNDGEERSVEHRSLNRQRSRRRVVWRPRRRSTGIPRDYWIHIAAALRFHHFSVEQWCLSVRPERHLTVDGHMPLPPHRIGRKVTRMKARMYNRGYLQEVVFWRDVLSGGGPRLILRFGSQSLVIESELLSVMVHWPGVPGDTGEFVNRAYEDDLFTLSELDEAIATGHGESGADDDIEDSDE